MLGWLCVLLLCLWLGYLRQENIFPSWKTVHLIQHIHHRIPASDTSYIPIIGSKPVNYFLHQAATSCISTPSQIGPGTITSRIFQLSKFNCAPNYWHESQCKPSCAINNFHPSIKYEINKSNHPWFNIRYNYTGIAGIHNPKATTNTHSDCKQ